MTTWVDVPPPVDGTNCRGCRMTIQDCRRAEPGEVGVYCCDMCNHGSLYAPKPADPARASTQRDLLIRAADMVRDKPEPWVARVVAPAIEAWLRDAAEAALDWEYWAGIQPHMYAAGSFARIVLGEAESRVSL